MPLEKDDQERVNQAIREAGIDGPNKIMVHNVSESQKLGPATVMCMILNRTIGSGIYVSPAIVLRSTGSVGVSLLLWSLVGPIITVSALLCWLEYGLSVPKYKIPYSNITESRQEGGNVLENVPSNGGEKNYLEHVFRSPRARATCLYAVIYVTLGNLSGNAIVFGIYMMEAAGTTGDDATVRGLAATALTAACILHALWRRGGILLNNLLAVVKVAMLLAVIVIGFAVSAGATFGNGPVHGTTTDPVTGKSFSNFDPRVSFARSSNNIANYTNSLLFVVYSYSGFEQPFYVMSEVSRPKRIFAKSTISAIVVIIVMYTLVNISYFCAVSVDQVLSGDGDMVTVFFSQVFGDKIAPRAISGCIAFSIFGNIVVMTFTAARVKQEIAKEGVLPFSLFFACSSTTPYAYLKQRLFPCKLPESQRPLPEQSPAAALLLHWIFCMLMIAATAGTVPQVAYTVLVSLYSYDAVILVRFFLAIGLLYLRWGPDRKTWRSTGGFKPWGGHTAPIIYATVLGFLLVTTFIRPDDGSPFSRKEQGVEWWIVPTVGLGFLVLGYAYYLCFTEVIPRIRKEEFIVEREPVIVKERGEWIQALEVVKAYWAARS